MAKEKKGKRNGKRSKTAPLPRSGLLRTEVLRDLALTHEHLAGELSELLRSHRLSESSYDLLQILRHEDARGGLPTLELAARMMRRGPDITRLSNRLESMELVRRERSPEDRRVVLVALTPAGETLVDALDRPLGKLRKKLLGHLSGKELRRLSELLAAARRAGGAG